MTISKKILRAILGATLSLCLLLSACTGGPQSPDIDDPKESNSESSSDVPANVEPETPPAATKKRVAITFDDGPHNVRTREIVDELDKYGFTATFFVVGNRVDGQAYRGGDTVKYIIEHGHEVGIHGYTHDVYYDECSDAEYDSEIGKTADAIHDIVKDYRIRLMRPVGGYITDERVRDNEYSVIMWNVDSLDYQHAYFPDTELSEAEQKERVDAIVNNVMSEVSDGSIILMHDLYLSTSHATAVILEKLHDEGYEVVSVSELLGDPVPGTKYNGMP